MRYAISISFLGYTRCNGVCAYNPEFRGFDDLTPSEARKLIDKGTLKGILWRNSSDGPEFYPDEQGFNQRDIIVRSANKFRPLIGDTLKGSPMSIFLALVRVLDTDYRGRLYEVIDNRCSRYKVTEQALRSLASVTIVSGCFIKEDEIEICDDIMYEDRRENKRWRGYFNKGEVVYTDREEKDQEQAKEVNADTVENMEKSDVKAELQPVEENKENSTGTEKVEEAAEDVLAEPVTENKEDNADVTENAEGAEEKGVESTESKPEFESMADLFANVEAQIDEQLAKKEEEKKEEESTKGKNVKMKAKSKVSKSKK